MQTTLFLQRDPETCGRQAAENATCTYFCNGELQGRAVTIKAAKSEKVQKKMLSGREKATKSGKGSSKIVPDHPSGTPRELLFYGAAVLPSASA